MGMKALKAPTLHRLTSGLQVKHLQCKTAFPEMNERCHAMALLFLGKVCMHFNVYTFIPLHLFTQKKKQQKKNCQFELFSGILRYHSPH